MPLGPKTQLYFEELKANQTRVLSHLPIADFRTIVTQYYDSLADKSKVTNITVIDDKIPSTSNGTINIRIYKAAQITNPTAGVIFFPGGGFVLELDNLHDSPCSKMAQQSGAVIIKVSYPLAPETKHDKSLMEAYQSTQYLYSNAANYGIDNKRFAVAGNSSGGNFAALVANKARYFHSINLAAQFLINPRTDVSLTSGGCTDYEIFEKQDIMLSKEDSLYFRNYYLPDTMDPRSPEISPYYDDLKGLPSTTLFAGEFDALRGDTEIYAEKLIAAGVKTKKLIGKGQTHSTMTARKVLSDGIDPAILIGKAIREELNPSYKPSE